MKKWVGRLSRDRQFVSAGEHLGRAAACYHFGKYLFSQDPEQMRTAHGKAVECYSLACRISTRRANGF